MNVSANVCVECSTPSPIFCFKIEKLISGLIKQYLPDGDLNKITNLVIIPLFFKLGLHLSSNDYKGKSIIIMPECWFKLSPDNTALLLERDETLLKEFTYALLHEVAHAFLAHAGCENKDNKENQVHEVISKWTEGTDIINYSPTRG